jgi:hypothetical protein
MVVNEILASCSTVSGWFVESSVDGQMLEEMTSACVSDYVSLSKQATLATTWAQNLFSITFLYTPTDVASLDVSATPS